MDALDPSAEMGDQGVCVLGGLQLTQPGCRGARPGGDAMGSLCGFRCDTCRAEFLVRPAPGQLSGRTGWSPPVLCCNQPLRRLEVDQVLPGMPTRRRIARCVRCGYEISLIVHPAGNLLCAVCQTEFLIVGGNPIAVTGGPHPPLRPIAPGEGSGRGGPATRHE
jgi:hypothetical protein